MYSLEYNKLAQNIALRPILFSNFSCPYLPYFFLQDTLIDSPCGTAFFAQESYQLYIKVNIALVALVLLFKKQFIHRGIQIIMVSTSRLF